MANTKVKSLREVYDRDVELCRLTSRRTSERLMKELVNNSVPFTEKWIRIPFYKRESYRGAREMCVIMTHRGQYSRARRILDGLDRIYKERIRLNVV